MYLPGNAARALRALGLEARVTSRAVEIPRQRFRDQRGRLLFEVDVAELWRPVGPCLAIHRADLHELLLEAADDVPIHLGLTVNRVTDQDRLVSVELSDGTSRDYDLVVAADGIGSAVRRLTFEPTALPRPVGQIGWRFLAPRPPELTTWSVMLGRRTAFLTLPIGDDRVYCYCDAVSPRDPDSADYGPAERLRQLFSEFAEPAATLLDALDAASDIHVSTIEEVALDSRAREHVVLIGDAAHATSPNMAQGRGDGARGRTGAHRLPAEDPGDPRRHRGIPGPPPTQNRRGPRPNPPPRPHQIPAADDQGQRPAIPRPANLPRQLPSAPGPALNHRAALRAPRHVGGSDRFG